MIAMRYGCVSGATVWIHSSQNLTQTLLPPWR